MSLRLSLLLFSFCFACHAFVVPNRPLHLTSSCLWAHRDENSPSSSRRVFLDTLLIGTVVVGAASSPAVAAEDAVTNPFDAVRRELQSAEGGIAYMQSCIDKADFTGLLEFTKTYDQVLRKGAMGKAKKTLMVESKDAAVLLSNAVTFDLIGINRSSRPGKENAQDAAKYLQELRVDVQKFLDLEGK